MIPDYYYTEYKHIPGLPEWYEINRMGDVRTKTHTIVNSLGVTRTIKGITCSQSKDKQGYCGVFVRGNGIQTRMLVHRLVAMTFLDNSDNLPCVNHKDECKHNNCVDNLEWCTYEYNNNYGTIKQRISETLKGHEVSAQTREKLRQANLGKTYSEETNKKRSEANKGRIPWNKGRKWHKGIKNV